jgi:hypothetical protein
MGGNKDYWQNPTAEKKAKVSEVLRFIEDFCLQGRTNS